tara:strand:+ start:579 stop:791 length:213 start_codon:yes stop_codon:yes gene_type:complete
MEVLSTVLSLVALVIFVYVCSGAILLIQDSDKRWKVRKELRNKYPDLTRDEIRVLSYIKLREMLEYQNEK